AAPFVEFLLGLGTNALEGRYAAADGLAVRLIELHERESVEWEDVALLFRASTKFPVYEDALERAGIPFVTVAGRGFYDRPEIRDLLNALAAVADPTDDLALVGLLRSPAVGLSDGALYSLRYPPLDVVPRDAHAPCQIWAMLHHPALPEIAPPAELSRALRGRDLVEELHDMTGRAPVAVLLKRLLDLTHYHAALQAVEGGPRARRNVSKLLADAHTSGLVSVREFVEYVRVLRDVGARESEAPTEAGSAVQLMTVHKAKGLEFPIVVIADAAHGGHWGSADILLDAQLGVTIGLRDEDGRRPAAYRLATLRDAERDEAENHRLLYVAATRAREKLLVSGHTKILEGGRLSLSGWLKLLGQAAGLDDVTVAVTPVAAQSLPLGESVGCMVYPWREGGKETGRAGDGGARRQGDKGTGRQGDEGVKGQGLVAPLVEPSSGYTKEAREAGPPARVWRVAPTAKRSAGPAWVVGDLVHVALCHWRFPDRSGLEDFLRPFALQAGLTDPEEIRRTIAPARRLLARFQAHPLYTELERAERHHELPYAIEVNGAPKSGVVDLLCRLEDKWTVVEFKTDELKAVADLDAHIRKEGYDEQVREYVAAVTRLMGERPRALLVFLNVGGEVEAAELD
ncbi:MAG: 3'-5' exonuclease, partial [Chloroflexota bacterium]|nr:3'-5' exonuclease [Chloroflexota bacterium]